MLIPHFVYLIKLISQYLHKAKSDTLLVNFCIVSLVFKLLFLIQTRYNQSLCSGMELNIKHQSYRRNKRAGSPECSNYIRSPGAYSHGKMFENWTLGNAISCIPWIERKIHTRILLRFSQSLVIHDPEPKYKDS